MPKLFNQCPACGGKIIITECKCDACHLQMRGDFKLGQFSFLSDDELAFIRVFLSARGNLSEVERVLGISYPTIRNKLDQINNDLTKAGESAETIRSQNDNAPADASTPAERSRKDILQKVADGQLTPEEAVQKLQEL